MGGWGIVRTMKTTVEMVGGRVVVKMMSSFTDGGRTNCGGTDVSFRVQSFGVTDLSDVLIREWSRNDFACESRNTGFCRPEELPWAARRLAAASDARRRAAELLKARMDGTGGNLAVPVMQYAAAVDVAESAAEEVRCELRQIVSAANAVANRWLIGGENERKN